MRAMSAGTVDAVRGRIRQAHAGAPATAGLSLGGASALSDALRTRGRALEGGALDVARLLAGSSFTLRLDAAGAGRAGLARDLTLWGSGGYRDFAAGTPQTVDHDGEVVTANLGVDASLSPELLAGMSVAWARGTVDYRDSHALEGELATTLTSIHPYVGWRGPGGVDLWATAGHGWGEVEIDDDAAGRQASDFTQQLAAAGVDGPLVRSDRMIAGGTTSLRIKADTAFTRADIAGSGTLQGMSLDVSRHRAMLEGEHVRELASGATLASSLEFGARRDGGDGETGGGFEVGVGLRYGDPATGLTVEGRARTLLGHSGAYEERGVSGSIRLAPDASGRGLSFSVQPAWGRADSSARRLWETGVARGSLPASRAAGRVHAELGYGLGVARDRGVVTPYAGLGIAGKGFRVMRTGARWQVGSDVSLGLEGTRREAVGDHGVEHALIMRGALRW